MFKINQFKQIVIFWPNQKTNAAGVCGVSKLSDKFA